MNRYLTLVVALAACKSAAPAAAPVAPPVPTTSPAPPPQKQQETPMTVQTAQPQQLAFPDEEFRKEQPKAGPPRPFKLPAMKPFTLANGIEVYLVEQHTLPIVSMDLNFDGGNVVDPAGKEGLASMCMSMLTEGTEKLDKIAYSEALADVASNINAYSTDDSQGVQLSSLTKHLEPTFALFAETLRSPGMRQADFDRMQKRRIEAVRQSRSSPTSIPGRVSGAILYGPKHPLGTVVTEQSTAAITLDECKKYVATWLKPKHARLFVVGDMTEAEVHKLFDGSALARWTGAAPKAPSLPAPKGMKGRIFFVHVANAPQSQVMLLAQGPKRTAPDYFASSIMSAVFGGSFTSRLNMNLREDKGYSYGARGGLSYTKAFGTLSVSAPVQADSSYQSVLEVARELEGLASGKSPVTKDELEREKTNSTLALPGRFATAQAALGQYRSLVYYGLPLDYFNTYVDKVGKVTEAQVKASAHAHLKPSEVVYLVVGNGDEKMIIDNPAAPKGALPKDRKIPYEKDGKQLTLREALQDLATRGDVGRGGFVELDVDGHPIK